MNAFHPSALSSGFALLAVLAAALTRRGDQGRTPRTFTVALVVWLAAGVVTLALGALLVPATMMATTPLPARARDLWIAGIALTDTIQWLAVAVLAFHALGAGDLVWVLPFGVLSVTAFVNFQDPRLAALLAIPALGRARWKPVIGRGRRRVLIAGVLWVYLALNFADLDFSTFLPAGAAVARTAIRYGEWLRAMCALYALIALVTGRPEGVVRPSRIRRVGVRLALSLALATLVPLALVAGLWWESTWMATASDRALTAARAIDEEGAALRAMLGAARPGDEAAARTAAAALAAREPGARVWRWSPGGGVHRLAGEWSGPEPAFEPWPDSLPQQGLARIGATVWLAARASSGPGAGLAALVPAESALARISRVVGAPVRVDPRYRVEPLSAPAGATSPGGSGAVIGFRGGQPVTTFSSHGRTIRITSPREGALLVTGCVVLPAASLERGGWRPGLLLLRSRITAREAALGLVRGMQENPFNLVPVAILVLLAVLVVVAAVANASAVVGMGRSITRAVAALRRGTAQLEHGDLAYRIAPEGNDELWSVAESFNRMAAGLERGREIEKEKQRVERELELARGIQQSMLPKRPPEVPGAEVAGRSDPARVVGGDYYDHLRLADGTLLLVIADVSGKGIPASLLMSSFRALVHARAEECRDPGALAAWLNQQLCGSLEPGKFITGFLGAFDPRTGRLRYTNAGHNPPLVLARGGAIATLDRGGLMLGVLDSGGYETGEASLAPGDLLVLYTDGVTEAQNAAGEMWEEQRLVETLRAHAASSCLDIAAAIAGAVQAHEAGAGQSDDITLVVVRRLA